MPRSKLRINDRSPGPKLVHKRCDSTAVSAGRLLHHAPPLLQPAPSTRSTSRQPFRPRHVGTTLGRVANLLNSSSSAGVQLALPTLQQCFADLSVSRARRACATSPRLADLFTSRHLSGSSSFWRPATSSRTSLTSSATSNSLPPTSVAHQQPLRHLEISMLTSATMTPRFHFGKTKC
jgi:hypothetical protein